MRAEVKQNGVITCTIFFPSQTSARYCINVANLYTIFSQLDAHGVYLIFDHIDPAFKQGRRLIGARCLFTR